MSSMIEQVRERGRTGLAGGEPVPAPRTRSGERGGIGGAGGNDGGRGSVLTSPISRGVSWAAIVFEFPLTFSLSYFLLFRDLQIK